MLGVHVECTSAVSVQQQCIPAKCTGAKVVVLEVIAYVYDFIRLKGGLRVIFKLGDHVDPRACIRTHLFGILHGLYKYTRLRLAAPCNLGAGDEIEGSEAK